MSRLDIWKSIMGGNQLHVLLLLISVVLSKAQDEETPCLMAKRYKSFNKYEYLYESESFNALSGQINGPKASCKVEIAVPGTCSFILRTRDCSLSEVTEVDADGNPVLGKAAGDEDFKTAMEKHPLKFTVKGDDDIQLFPENGELTNILNIKRGIISALAVPVVEEDENKEMPTIYGLCQTDYIMSTSTEVTFNRDLSRCDKFRPIQDYTSPLALITGMHHLLAQLISSNQTCSYKFDDAQLHMTSGICTEKHILLPFSFKDKYGITNTGKQALTLLGVTEYNDQVFDYNVANMKPLHLDRSFDKSPIQDKEAVLNVLRELVGLSNTNKGRKRAYLAHKLVAVMRKMEAETLTAALPDALDISRPLTYQALLQCGTPECGSAIMQVFRTFDRSSVETDIGVYAMGIIPQSSRILVKEMLMTAKFKPSKPIYYALSNAVRRLYETDGVTSEIQAVADYALEQTGDCTGDQEHIFLSLRVIGNMVAALGAAHSGLHSAVIQCINQPKASPVVQQAAIQVYRQIPVPEEGRDVLLNAVLDRAASVQKRVAAYLILMKNPTPAELAQLAAALQAEKNQQAKSFITSHISNILSSSAPETQDLRYMIQEAFQGNEIGMIMEPNILSQYYRLGSLEGNMIFESPNELPREVMLEMTLNAFGFDMDLIEIGMEGKGFEPIVEALFGDDGFFPDTVMKTILYATDKIPAELSEVLDNILSIMTNDRKKRQATQNIVKEISQSVNKLFEDLKAQDAPEVMVYLRLLGAELGYLDTKDGKMLHDLLRMIPTDFVKRLFSSVDNELFLHYIFMDNEFYLPTGAGFPLRVALSGTFTPGIKGGLTFNPGMKEFVSMLSAGIEFVTEMGTHFPDYVQSGLEMHTSIYHESGLKAKLSVTKGQLKLSIPAPNGPTELFSVTNSLASVVGAKIVPISATGRYTNVENCIPVFPGLNHCASLKYFDEESKNTAPFFPLTGETKFAVELQPSGTVTEYTATINYAYDDEADEVAFNLKAEGTAHEVISTVILNRKEDTISARMLIESLQIDCKVSAKVKSAEKMTLEIASDLKFPLMVSVQTLILKYESEKIEVEVKSNVNYEIQRIISNMEVIETIVNRLLNSQTNEDRMEIQEFLAKAVVYLGGPATSVMNFPENLFLNVEAAGKYHFGQPYYTITFPLPLGGKSTLDLKFPTTLSIPDLTVPLLDLEFESTSINIPEILIPISVSLSVPTFEMAEISGKLSSNLYNLDAAVSAARDPATQSTFAKVEVTGISPIDLLSLKVEGSALVEATSDDSFKANIKTVVHHEIINITVSVEEEVEIAEKLSVKSRSTFEGISCVGVEISLEHAGKIDVDAEQISGDGNLQASFKAGSVQGSGNLKQSVSLLPYRPETKIDSSLKIDSTLLRAQNTFALAFSNGELLILSNTTTLDNRLTNIAKITFRESQLALNSQTKAKGFGMKIHNTAETKVGAEAVNVKIETSTDISEERIYSLLTGALDINGLVIHSDASAKLMRHTADHKANLTFSKEGLTTRGTTILQSIFTMEELKHTFEIIYKNLTVTVQCKTVGSIMGSDVNHNTDLEIAGLSGSVRNHLRFNSRIFNIETNTRGTTSPIHFSFDAKADGDESVYLFGYSSGNFNAKVLLKLEPQSLVHSHDVTISNVLEIYRLDIKTELESKSDILLTPSEQKAKVNVKAKVNEYAINQEISVYNTPAQLGLEGSGSVVTNLFNTADTAYQDFTISGFLKYDKNNNRHSVNLPFLESLVQFPDSIRKTCVITGETLRNYINREGISSKIQKLPQLSREFVSKLNFETRAVQLKDALIALSQEYALKLELLRGSLIRPFEKLLSDMGSRFSEALGNLKGMTVKGTLIEDVVELIHALLFSITKDVQSFLNFINTQGHPKLNDIFYPDSPDNPLQIPTVSKSLPVPSFGKLYGQVRFSSPVYNIKTSAEIKNTSGTHPHFTAFIKSEGTSNNLEILNYNLDSTAQIFVPEMSPVKVTESVKLIHTHLTLDQQATLTLNGSTSNNASVSSYSLETSYENQINVPSHSMSCEVTLNQKADVYQDDAVVTLTVKHEGTRKFALKGFADEGTHKSDLDFKMGLSAAKLTIIGYTDSDALQMKMNMNADAVALSHLQFNASVETKSPFIKSSALVASGMACFSSMRAEFEAFHNTEFVGVVNGVLSNNATFATCPFAVGFDFLNSGNATINLYESFPTYFDFQNDYSLAFNPEIHAISSVANAQLNNYNYSHNFTANHRTTEMGIYSIVNIDTNFWFLNAAEMFVPVIFKIPAITYLNFDDNPELWDDLTTNDQTIYLNGNFVYQKTMVAPNIDMGLAVLSLGNLTSEVLFESPVLNLSANAGIYPKDNLMNISATSKSVFQQLGAQLDGTTSLTTESGLQLASALYLDNAHIQGSHNSTVTLKDDNQVLLTADTVAKINLTTFTVDATHQLSADTKAHPKALSNLKINYTLDQPESESAGHGEAENTLKLDSSLSFISIESATQVITNSTPVHLLKSLFYFPDEATLNGTLNNNVNIYVQVEGLKSNLRTTGNGYINFRYSKLWFDINDQVTLNGNLERIYSSLEINSNYTYIDDRIEYPIKHIARGKTDFLPLSTLVAAVDIFLSQPDGRDFKTSDEGWTFSQNTLSFKQKAFSRWFNSSISLYAGEKEEKVVYDFSYNFTSPSLLMEYQGGLNIVPAERN